MQSIASSLSIDLLRTYWRNALGDGMSAHAEEIPWDLQQTMLSGLGLNVLETGRFLHEERPSYEEFESWILQQNGGGIDAASLERLRRALTGETVGSAVGSLEDVPGLNDTELAHWEEHGYVVLKDAVSPEAAEAAELAIYDYLVMSRDDPGSWYAPKLGHTIWVPVLHHPAIEANRRSARITKAFAQLWGREDMWPVIDQGGLNPPERPGWKFPGPHLHWDTTLAAPHYFGVQGILYLADTTEEQGAFCCVPGFHKQLSSWLESIPLGVNPRDEALRTLKMKPIAARRGDLVMWHHSLPHGSSPNRATRPRVVQYLTMRPTRWPYNPEWL